jgi:hypothetical protein
MGTICGGERVGGRDERAEKAERLEDGMVIRARAVIPSAAKDLAEE